MWLYTILSRQVFENSIDFEPVAGGTICVNGAIVAAKYEIERVTHAVYEREDFQVKVDI